MSSKVTTKTYERGVKISSKSKSYAGELDVAPSIRIREHLIAVVLKQENEKKDMGTLNQKMSSYVDRVKALEVENFKLLKEIQDIRGNWGLGTKGVKKQFESDLHLMRVRIDDTANLKALADVKLKRSQHQIVEHQCQIESHGRLQDAQKYKVLDLEGELQQSKLSIDTLKKEMDDEQADIHKYKDQYDMVKKNMAAMMDKYDAETLRRLSIEHSNQTIRENIEFLRQVNERELIEMRQLLSAYPFNDQIEFYKDQLKKVIRNIRQDYDQLSAEQQREMQEWMRIKTEEIENRFKVKDSDLELGLNKESCGALRKTLQANSQGMNELAGYGQTMLKRLHELEEYAELERRRIGETLNAQTNEIDRLSGSIKGMEEDQEAMRSHEISLRSEINVYKRLLDTHLARQVVTEVKETSNQATVSTGAFGGKVQNMKEKKGPVGIEDASPDARFVLVENSSSSSEGTIDLTGWSLKRKVDAQAEISYTFPAGTLIRPGKAFRIWGKLHGKQAHEGDLVNGEVENWGIGMNTTTRLVNAGGEDRSRFNQTITFGHM